MVRYDFRHGPRQAQRAYTHHRSAQKAHKHAVSEYGYCQLHAMDGDDVPGTEMAWWRDGLEVFKIAVCEAHKDDKRLAKDPS